LQIRQAPPLRHFDNQLGLHSYDVKSGINRLHNTTRRTTFLPSKEKEASPNKFECDEFKRDIQWVPGALFLGVKRLGTEVDHSLQSSVEVKECVELFLHSPTRLHCVVLSYSTDTPLPLPFRHFYHPPL
jgi:hypothetical protein